MAIPVETFFLPPDAQGTLQAQIQQMIAEGILSGRFRPGERLPSSRALARHLGLSRITVTLAYTELVAGDYLAARDRSGYFVSATAPVPPVFDPPSKREDRIDWGRALARRFSGGETPVKPLDWHRYRYPFVYGQADPGLLDHANWRLCALKAHGARDFPQLAADSYDRDDEMLVEFIARHTLPRRGIAAGPREILITLGAQNALWLAAQVLLGPARQAVIETPSYPALRDIIAQTGCRSVAVAVDADGLPADAIPPATDVIFCTPSHQCPTSATMPMPRREALLARAAERDALIVEDDYEFEMSYLRAPYPALKSLDREGRVIYVGSFSKSLFPGLRLGYLVGSEPFIREARALRASVLRHPPGLMQRTAAYFLSLGHYDAQVRRTAKALHARRQALEEAVAHHGLVVAGRGAGGGSSLWMRAGADADTRDLARGLAGEGVLIEPGAVFFAGARKPAQFYRLGYSSIPEARIAGGVERIAAALRARNWL